jgi:Domain of unknown function (DUF4357)
MTTPKPLGTSIKIFLADGDPDGVWVVQKTNWTGKALMAPRTRYLDLRARPDFSGPGVYVLVGPTESAIQSMRVYIGETDDLLSRLNVHYATKEFWNRLIVFTSKDENLNKAHIRYLEARLIGLAKAASRAELDNGNDGSATPMSEADRAEMDAFLAEMLVIYPVLGVHVFNKPDEQPSGLDRLYLTGMDGGTEGAEKADGFVVYKDSRAKATEAPSVDNYITRIRLAMIESGRLVGDGEQLRLTEDYLFSSPSTAAKVMLGRSINGREAWKTKGGQTLKDLQAALA